MPRTEAEERNLEIIREFYRLSFGEGRPEELVAKHFGDRYIQHNPNLDDGAEAFIEFVHASRQRSPEMKGELKYMYADGDAVVLHSRWTGISKEAFTRMPDGTDSIIVADFFRFEDDKIVEHWDVIQPESATSEKPHGML